MKWPTTFTNGEGGIRTPDGCDTITDFESAAFNRSATSPIAHITLSHQVWEALEEKIFIFPRIQG